MILPFSIWAKILGQNVSFCCSSNSVPLSKGNSISLSLGSFSSLLDTSCVVSMLEGETMGFMQIQSLDITEITTEASTEPSSIILEDDNKEVLNKQEGEGGSKIVEKRFITSPADIEVHRKVELQDADITDEQ